MISKEKNKLISVIIPVKNGGNYIQEAIDAIQKQNMDLEIIVVDDASTDNTAEIAQHMGCIVLKHQESKGPVVAKNSALKIAKGDYILFHDHDDVMNQNILSKMYEELSSNNELSAVMAKVQDFISPDALETNNAEIKKEAYWGLFTGAVLMRKNVFDTIGLFDESITAGEIISWQMKMNENRLQIKKIDMVSTNRRIHSNNFGRTNQKKEYQDYASILRAKLARK